MLLKRVARSKKHTLKMALELKDTIEFVTAYFVGLELGDEFYLTDGSSLVHLRPAKGEGYARLALHASGFIVAIENLETVPCHDLPRAIELSS